MLKLAIQRLLPDQRMFWVSMPPDKVAGAMEVLNSLPYINHVGSNEGARTDFYFTISPIAEKEDFEDIEKKLMEYLDISGEDKFVTITQGSNAILEFGNDIYSDISKLEEDRKRTSVLTSKMEAFIDKLTEGLEEE